MSTEHKERVELEIGHVLFIDIVAYSQLSLNQQRAAIEELNEIVRASAQYQKSEADRQLIKLATGDGMALVFTASPPAPVQCAVELARALKVRDLTWRPTASALTGAGIVAPPRIKPLNRSP